MAPLGDPGALLGAPGAPSGVQGRESDEKRGSFPPVPGPVLEHFSVKNCFFYETVLSWSVFFCEGFFLLNVARFFVDFLTPWNHKNTNFCWEWHRNQENHKIASWAPSGAILEGFLAPF